MGWCSADALHPCPTSLQHTCSNTESLGKAKLSWWHSCLVFGGLAFLLHPSLTGSWWQSMDETLSLQEMLRGSQRACARDKWVSNGVPLPASKPRHWTCQTQIMALRQHAVPCLGGLSEDRDHSKCDFVEPCPLSLCLFSLLLLPPDLCGSALSPDSPWQLIS